MALTPINGGGGNNLYEEKSLTVTVISKPTPKFSDYVDYWSAGTDKAQYYPGETVNVKLGIAFKKACDYRIEVIDARGNVVADSGWKNVSSARDISESVSFTAPSTPGSYSYKVRLTVDEYGTHTAGGLIGTTPIWGVNPYGETA